VGLNVVVAAVVVFGMFVVVGRTGMITFAAPVVFKVVAEGRCGIAIFVAEASEVVKVGGVVVLGAEVVREVGVNLGKLGFASFGIIGAGFAAVLLSATVGNVGIIGAIGALAL